MLKKTLYSFLLLIVFTQCIKAQTVFSNGGSSSNQLTYTIGEPLTNTLSNPNNVVTQGFNQPYLSIVSVEELNVEVTTTIYPNPSMEYFTVTVNGATEDLYGYVYGIKGNYISATSLQNDNKINVNDLQPGTYLLVVKTKKNEPISRTKFIKSASK